MVLTRKNRVHLLIFGLVTVLAVGYVGGQYVGLDRLFSNRGYLVHVELADSGGIFVNAEVAYRGVTVGRVHSLHLTDTGVVADVDIEDDELKIPADTEAAVANRSAIGEQYIDLRPRSEGGPYLEDGSVIDKEDTELPTAPETLLSNLSDFAASVNPESLQVVADEAHAAFAGTGPDLQRLLDASSSLTETAQENLPQTRDLLAQSRVVLDTQRRHGDNLQAIADGLHEIAGQLKEADPDLRQVVDQAPELSQEISDLVYSAGPSTGVVLANMLTTSRIATVRTDAIEEILVAAPVASAISKSITKDGEGKLALVLNFFDPPSCTRGYEGTVRRGADEVTEIPPNTEAYCAEPAGSWTAVRGAQKVPYAGPAPEPAEAGEIPGISEAKDSREIEAVHAEVAHDEQRLPGLLDLSEDASEVPDLATLLGLPQ